MDIPPPPSSVPPPPPPPPPSFSAAPPPGFPAAPPPGYGSAPAGNGIAPRPGLAVAALVLGIVGVCLCFLFVPSLLALIFGVRAARKIRRSEAAGQPMAGKGFAKAGWILGIVGIVAFAAFVVVAIVTDDNKVQLSELEVGDCVDIGGFGTDARIDELPRVDCDTPHDGEVYAVDTLPSGAYPGLDEVKDEVAARCNADVTDYVDADVDLSELTYASIYPPEDGWPKHRDYFCILTSADDSKLTGPINDSGG